MSAATAAASSASVSIRSSTIAGRSIGRSATCGG